MRARLLMAPCVVAGLAAWLGTSPNSGPGPVGQAASGILWFWAINGPVSADAGGDMVVDSLGNVFIAGGHGGLDLNHDDVVDLPSGATAYVGANNPLFMKLGRRSPSEPLRILWTRSPSTPADRSQTKVAVDGRGGVYASGAFMESLAFEGGPTLAGAGGNDAFIARYDGDGSVVWARVFGGPDGNDAIYSLASDGEANVYVAGTASGTFALDDHGAEFRSPVRRAVVVSYDPSGSVRWTRTFSDSIPLAYGVRIAPSGQVYVTGEFVGATDFDDDGTIDLPRPRDRDGFVARFDGNGTFLGAWAVPSPTMPAFTSDGDVILGGGMGGPIDRRYGPADFDGDGMADIELKGGGPTGTWLARYSPEGELRWVRSSALERPADLEVRGEVFVLSGNYTGIRDLDEDGRAEVVDHTVDPSIETDMAIMLLSARDGSALRVWTAPGPGNDWANAVAFVPNEPSLLVTGAIQLTADFTGDGEAGEGWIVCENLGDLFVAEYQLPEAAEPVEPAPPPPPRPQEEAEPPGEIVLEASLVTEGEGEGEGERVARVNLTWSGAKSDRIDVYYNGELLATVRNNGSLSYQLRSSASPPYRYRVCEAGTTRCSATREAGP